MAAGGVGTVGTVTNPTHFPSLEWLCRNTKISLFSVRHAGLKDPAPHHDAGGIQSQSNLTKHWIPSQARNDKNRIIRSFDNYDTVSDGRGPRGG